MAIATFKRFHDDLGMTCTKRFNFDNTWLQQTILHGLSFSIPSVRYTDKADGAKRNTRLAGRRAGKQIQTEIQTKIQAREQAAAADAASVINGNTVRRSAIR